VYLFTDGVYDKFAKKSLKLKDNNQMSYYEFAKSKSIVNQYQNNRIPIKVGFTINEEQVINTNAFNFEKKFDNATGVNFSSLNTCVGGKFSEQNHDASLFCLLDRALEYFEEFQ